MKKIYMFILIIAVCFSAAADSKVRLKEISRFQGVRSNQLLGMGIVVGLNGTGDKGTLAAQMMKNLIEYFGNDIAATQVKSQNVATVMVTAELTAFKNNGDTIDVTVSSLSDAKSLEGGILLMTPLKGADGKVYAVAQGALIKVTAKATNKVNGTIPGGATVETEIPTELEYGDKVIVILNNSDFTTASRVVDAINERFKYDSAKAIDGSKIEIKKSYAFSNDTVSFLSAIENLEVSTDRRSIITINEKTGTVILGENITISPVAISHGTISISIDAQLEPEKNTPPKDPKNPGTRGSIFYLTAPTVKDVIKLLNGIGSTPDDIISILQALKSAGAIDVDIKII